MIEIDSLKLSYLTNPEEIPLQHALTSYLPMFLKKHMLTDPIVVQIIISQNQNN